MTTNLHYGNFLKPYQPLSEDDDYWFTEQELAAFIGTRKPQTEWHKFNKSYPWIWVGGKVYAGTVRVVQMIFSGHGRFR